MILNKHTRRTSSIYLVVFLIPCMGRTQTDTSYFSVIMKTKITGEQKIWKSSSQEVHVSYQYNDRGRGDSTESNIKINELGVITSIKTSGLDYFKNLFGEEYTLSGDSAFWQINKDKGSAKFTGQLYDVVGGGPALWGLSLKAILLRPGKCVPLLPRGSKHMVECGNRSISINGSSINLTLYSLYEDADPTPKYVWMTRDTQLFALITIGFKVIERGSESLIDSLSKIQETISRKFYSRQLMENSSSLPRNICLTHANLFDAGSARVRKNMTIKIKDGKIISVYHGVRNIRTMGTVINCTGKFMMPGLWDMHSHYQKSDGIEYLSGGITHIRDMGNDKILLDWKQQIKSNELLGPDISYVSGFIDKEDPYQGRRGTIIRSLSEGLVAIDEYHSLGYNQIKLYSAIKPEWVKPLASHAHALGLRVCGHIPAFMTAEQAINDGYDEITHMNFIFLNFLGDSIDTRTRTRLTKVGEEGAKLDLHSLAVKRFVLLMKTKHIALDATMNVWEGLFDEFDGDSVGFLKPVANWVPDSWKEQLIVNAQFGKDEQKKIYKSAFVNMLKMLKLLYDNGILLVAGTDGWSNNALHHELELYVLAGIPAIKVLQIATYNAALDCSLQNNSGQILIGRLADLIIIDGDPTKNIGDIRRIETVIKNGRIYQPKQLMEYRGWKYYN